MARRRRGRPVHGWVALDKPPGISSAQAVSRVRRAIGAAKAGHAGTLDPLATGVLPVALGEATKTAAWAVAGRKTYRFTVAWGEARDTDDAEGAVEARSAVRPAAPAIEAALPAFRGRILQAPPRYSAVRIGGRRSYALARAEIDARPAPREVEIDALALIDRPDDDRAVFEMRCGKGAYVRSLARDLALALGTVGHVREIRRTAVGRFVERTAISLERLEALVHTAPPQDYLLPVETALDDIPALALPEGQASLLRRGQPVRIEAARPRPGTPGAAGEGGTVLAVSAGRPVALARIEGGALRPVRVFSF